MAYTVSQGSPQWKGNGHIRKPPGLDDWDVANAQNLEYWSGEDHQHTTFGGTVPPNMFPQSCGFTGAQDVSEVKTVRAKEVRSPIKGAAEWNNIQEIRKQINAEKKLILDTFEYLKTRQVELGRFEAVMQRREVDLAVSHSELFEQKLKPEKVTMSGY